MKLKIKLLQRRLHIAIVMLMMTVVQTAWADNPTWLKSGDTWDATTKTLTVNSTPSSHAYENNTEIEHLVIGNRVESISPSTFENCINLATVAYEGTPQLKIIYYFAFKNCTSLTSITIPASVKTIQGGEPFIGCSNLTTMVVDTENEKYKSENDLLMSKDGTALVFCPFQKAKGDFSIPDGVSNINFSAFFGCTGLTSIAIPASVKTINANVFQNCTNLETVTFAAGSQLSNINSAAFSGCTSLAGITLPNGLTTIGKDAFSGCTSLTTIHIPASVTDISGLAFRLCSGLASFTVDDGNEKYSTINGVLLSKDGTELVCYPIGRTETSYTLPAGITNIRESTFQGCTVLRSVILPDGLENIDESAFEGCTDLTSIILPDNLKQIAASAFKDCTSLTSITLPDGLSSIGISAFEGCTGLTSITLPYTLVYAPGKNAFKDCTNLVTVIDMCQYADMGEYIYSISGTFGNVNSSCHFYVRNRNRVSDYKTYSSIITVVSGIYTSSGAIATTTVEPFFTINGMNYYTTGSEFTISNNGAPNGYSGECKGYKVTDGKKDITSSVLNGTTLTLPDKDVVVMALFDIVTYTITLELDGGSWVVPSLTYTVENPNISLDFEPGPQKANYDFIGWTGPGYNEPTKDVIIPRGSYGDRTYTAHWRPKEYSITYNLAGGSLPEGVTNPTTYTIETETFTLNNPTREGYCFVGWLGSNVSTLQHTVTITKGTYDDLSYTAYWAYLLTNITDANVSEIVDKPVALHRSFTQGKASTICLPIAPTALLDVGSVWEFTGISADHKAVMTQRTSGLQANTPYIFIPATSFSGHIWGVAVSSIDLDPKTVDGTAGFTFHGTYTQKHWDADDPLVTGGKIYGFMVEDNDGQSMGQFVRARRATNLRAFSCYLEYNGNLTDTNPSSKSRTRGEAGLPDVIDIIWQSAGGTTGIDATLMNNELMKNDSWYSLDGRRLQGRPSAKGLYIHNGKKVVIK